jgi:hypothetical protein
MKIIILALSVYVIAGCSIEEKVLNRPSLSIEDATELEVFIDTLHFECVNPCPQSLKVIESWKEQIIVPNNDDLATSERIVIRFSDRLKFSEIELVAPSQINSWGVSGDRIFILIKDREISRITLLYFGQSIHLED